MRLTGAVADWLAQAMPAVDIEDRILTSAQKNRRDNFVPPSPSQNLSQNMPQNISQNMSQNISQKYFPKISMVRMKVMWRVHYKGMLAAHASTGEQKALLIAIILAHAVLQEKRLQPPACTFAG